jgi:uncharacterized DUF497 family protein
MTLVDYEWDPVKAETNRKKHGVLFADAVGVFEDEGALSREDPAAMSEQRFIATGLDHLGRVLTVVYMWRGEESIRLISARRATKNERQDYEGRS